MEDILDSQTIWRDFCEEMGDAAPSFMSEDSISVFACIDSTSSELLRRLQGAGASFDVPDAPALLNADGRLTERGRRANHSLVAACQQTAGRGRLGRSFYSPSNTGIYFSFALVPEGGVKAPASYTVAAAVGVCRAIERLYGAKALIKWVNDVYIGGKKVCGILTEGVSSAETGIVEAAVIGIGINIEENEGLPLELSAKAGSILGSGGQNAEAPKEGGRNSMPTSSAGQNRRQNAAVTRSRLLAACMAEIARALPQSNAHNIEENTISEYRARSFLLGQRISVTPLAGIEADEYEALALAITDDAGLLVRLDDGTERVLNSGEVTLHSSTLNQCAGDFYLAN